MGRYLQDCENVDAETASSPMLEKWSPHMDDVWRGFLERD